MTKKAGKNNDARQRRCLRCLKSFLSGHKANRLCSGCARDNLTVVDNPLHWKASK